MPRRNSPAAIRDLSDLTGLGDVVYDKRRTQRADAKKNRRNRHYEKLFIRHALTHRAAGGPVQPSGADDDADADGGS